MNIKVDLFSDTNFEPTVGMRQYMCMAEVGNEVAGEDPTVNRLIERVCQLLGHEAGMFLPTGTMANGVSLRALCERPGDIIAFSENAHALKLAAGLPAGLVSATPITIPSHRGIFDAESLHECIKNSYGYNLPYPRVVSIEQTTNYGGGAVWPLEKIQEIVEYAKKKNIKMHMDGARLFNAVEASGIDYQDYCRGFDAVWVDFSKALGAPMGAVLVGSKKLIDNAWYYKFQQGGGMHQAGILAAACMYGLDHHLTLIPKLHDNTKYLAKKLKKYSWINLNIEQIETNIVIFSLANDVPTAYQLVEFLQERGIRMLAISNCKVRCILHLGISKKEIDYVVSALDVYAEENIFSTS